MSQSERLIAMKLLLGYKQNQDCPCVKKVLEHYKFQKEKLMVIENYFFMHKTVTATCMRTNISRPTFYRWEREILDIAVKWAKELKLIKEN